MKKIFTLFLLTLISAYPAVSFGASYTREQHEADQQTYSDADVEEEETEISQEKIKFADNPSCSPEANKKAPKSKDYMLYNVNGEQKCVIRTCINDGWRVKGIARNECVPSKKQINCSKTGTWHDDQGGFCSCAEPEKYAVNSRSGKCELRPNVDCSCTRYKLTGANSCKSNANGKCKAESCDKNKYRLNEGSCLPLPTFTIRTFDNHNKKLNIITTVKCSYNGASKDTENGQAKILCDSINNITVDDIGGYTLESGPRQNGNAYDYYFKPADNYSDKGEKLTVKLTVGEGVDTSKMSFKATVSDKETTCKPNQDCTVKLPGVLSNNTLVNFTGANCTRLAKPISELKTNSTVAMSCTNITCIKTYKREQDGTAQKCTKENPNEKADREACDKYGFKFDYNSYKCAIDAETRERYFPKGQTFTFKILDDITNKNIAATVKTGTESTKCPANRDCKITLQSPQTKNGLVNFEATGCTLVKNIPLEELKDTIHMKCENSKKTNCETGSEAYGSLTGTWANNTCTCSDTAKMNLDKDGFCKYKSGTDCVCPTERTDGKKCHYNKNGICAVDNDQTKKCDCSKVAGITADDLANAMYCQTGPDGLDTSCKIKKCNSGYEESDGKCVLTDAAAERAATKAEKEFHDDVTKMITAYNTGVKKIIKGSNK